MPSCTCDMARAPQPLTVEEDISEPLRSFIGGVRHVGDYDFFAYRQIFRKSEEIQKVDVVRANCIQAALFSITGQFDKFEAALLNAERNNGRVFAVHRWYMHYANHLFAKKTFDLIDEVCANRLDQTLMHLLSAAVAVGAFRKSLSIVEDAQQRGEVLKMTNLIEVIKKSSRILDGDGISEGHALGIVDIAGSIMRDKKLVWLDSLPEVQCLEAGQGGPVVSIAYHVAVSPSEAANMTWELISRRIDAGLESSAFQVSFTGVELPSDFSSLHLD